MKSQMKILWAICLVLVVAGPAFATRTLKEDASYNLMVFMVDATDHRSGKTGLTLTVTASKNGSSFSSITPFVTEISNGWYNLALSSSHTDTIGDLALHITATGADPLDIVMQVRANILGDTLPVNITEINSNASSATNLDDAFNESGGSGVALALESVTVNNPNGTAVTFSSSGGNGHGMLVSGNGSGDGMQVNSGATGGGLAISGNDFGLAATGTGSTNSHGIWAAASTGSGHGIYSYAGGTGNAIRSEGAMTVTGLCRWSATSQCRMA